MPCPYSHVLGVPGQGVHAARVGPYSQNDILATIVLAIITSYVMNIHVLYSFLAWFVAGEILHYLFGTQTAFLTTLGINACPK